MSEYTFNIADYRALAAVRARSDNQVRIAERGLVVLTPREELRHTRSEVIDFTVCSSARVADIRAIRENRWAHRYSPQLNPHFQNAKVVPFGHQDHSRVQPICEPVRGRETSDPNDPGELPPAA